MYTWFAVLPRSPKLAAPVIDAAASLLGLGVHGLDHVGGLERATEERKHAEAVERERLLEAFVVRIARRKIR